MDTVETLYDKYLSSLGEDIRNGFANSSLRTQILLAFYQEVQYRLSANVEDQLTADQLLTYTHQNYS
jgi:hypothetical protein